MSSSSGSHLLPYHNEILTQKQHFFVFYVCVDDALHSVWNLLLEMTSCRHNSDAVVFLTDRMDASFVVLLQLSTSAGLAWCIVWHIFVYFNVDNSYVCMWTLKMSSLWMYYTPQLPNKSWVKHCIVVSTLCCLRMKSCQLWSRKNFQSCHRAVGTQRFFTALASLWCDTTIHTQSVAPQNKSVLVINLCI